ncbi:MAG: hypothetical protein JSW37_11130, partial [Anaerolineales bacterium]
SPRELLVNALYTVRCNRASQWHPMASRESIHACQLEQLQELVAFGLLLDAGADIAAFVIRGAVRGGGKHHPIISHVTQRMCR